MSLLGLLNFIVFQWFCVRLQVSFNHVCLADEPHRWWDHEIPARDKVSFSLLRWVLPLTGWWSPYRFITRDNLAAWLSPTAWFNALIVQWFFVRVGWKGRRPCLVKWIWPCTGLWIGSCMRFVDGTHLGRQGLHPKQECQ